MSTRAITRAWVEVGFPLALVALAALPACRKSDAADKPLSGNTAEGPMEVPVPAADGPKIYARKDGVAVVERPAAGARMIGELRMGAVVARSADKYGKAGCDGGWYAVRPRGFVCAGDAATLDDKAAKGLPAPPRLDRPLPYRYGRTRTEGVVLYGRVPSPEEQQAAEPDLMRWLPSRNESDSEPLGAAASDVPVDARLVPTGPPVLLPGGDGIDARGRRTALAFFTFPSDTFPAGATGAGDVKAGSLRKNSGVSLTASFLAPGPSGPRRFGVTPDGKLVPTDRLRPALGATWHGLDIDKLGLPLAFIHKSEVSPWKHSKGKATKQDEELERRSAVPMTGKFRTVGGVRFEETREGHWLRSQDIVVIVKRSKWPEFAVAQQKWIDVSLANQTMTLYEGKKPVYGTLISSGRDQIGDPATTASTVRGSFRVRSKHISRPLDSKEVHQGFEVADAPWMMEFEPGYSLGATYWNDSAGEASNFHNVTMAPVDARRVWAWADPQLPEGWHGVLDTGGATTMVSVRP